MDAEAAWTDAKLAAILLAMDPVGLRGACVHGRAGGPRDAWLKFLRSVLPAARPLRRVPLNITDERLLGGLDWLDALRNGQASYYRGVLEACDSGFVVVPSSERIPPRLCSHLTACIDDEAIALERDGLARRIPVQVGVIALDESLDEESRTPAQLIDRLAFLIDADALGAMAPESPHDAAAIDRARSRLQQVEVSDETVASLCAAAASLGVDPLRAAILAVRTARAAAALAGRKSTNIDDAQVAARLVLAPRATRMPADEEASPPEAGEPASAPSEQPADTDAEKQSPASPNAEDLVLAAAIASLPRNILERIAAQGAAKRGRHQDGRSGAFRKASSRGRPAGIRAGKPGGGIRLNLVETLRAAAPWQRVRRATSSADGNRLVRVRATDLRVTRHKQRTRTTTIFVVDASGSAALNRMAEAKGAVELLLADCYVRRDQVCVIAFRGTRAEILLPPTRSLARAKRELAGLPGGGATPLAAALQLATAMAEQIARAGFSVTQVLLTDGSANVALDGSYNRERAEADAQAMASRVRAEGIATIVVDIAQRAQRQAESLARTMGARYLWLPRADAASISDAIRNADRKVS